MYKYFGALVLAAALLLPAYADDDKVKAIKRDQAEYPKKARKKCIEGNVVVRFVITTEGKTSEIEVLSSKPEGVFEKAAVQAVKGWLFEKPMLHGVPVNRESTQRLVFEPGCTS